MLKRLVVKNFTVFREATFDFSPAINVIIGENGTGKSHVLKLAYCALAVSAWGERESGSAAPTNSYLGPAVARKLRSVFRPDELGRLARTQPGRSRTEIEANYRETAFDLAFSFNTSSKSEVTIQRTPTRWLEEPPVYLPTRELLTIYPGFVSLYETSELPFEETWRDTCILLGTPLSKGARLSETAELLEPLENHLGGKVLLEDGRFYVAGDRGKFEAHLVAEGLRKLAMIARLIATGSLTKTGTLFWDEPEANLNPKIIKTGCKNHRSACRGRRAGLHRVAQPVSCSRT